MSHSMLLSPKGSVWFTHWNCLNTYSYPQMVEWNDSWIHNNNKSVQIHNTWMNQLHWEIITKTSSMKTPLQNKSNEASRNVNKFKSKKALSVTSLNAKKCKVNKWSFNFTVFLPSHWYNPWLCSTKYSNDLQQISYRLFLWALSN